MAEQKNISHEIIKTVNYYTDDTFLVIRCAGGRNAEERTTLTAEVMAQGDAMQLANAIVDTVERQPELRRCLDTVISQRLARAEQMSKAVSKAAKEQQNN